MLCLTALQRVPMQNSALSTSSSTQVQAQNWLAGRHFAVLLVAFLIYTIAGRANLYLITLRPPTGSIWVPAGLALAAVLLYGRSLAPAVFLGTLIVALTSSAFPWGPSLAISAGNTIEVFLASYLI